jgi:hypothetical protein
MILGELGEAPDSPVSIFFLYQIFGDASRIFQTRVTPKLGEAVLQGLNSTLHKKCHETKLLLGLLSKLECRIEEEELVLFPHLREAHPTTLISSLP